MPKRVLSNSTMSRKLKGSFDHRVSNANEAKEKEILEKIRALIRSNEANKFCFDCGERSVTFVNCTVGSFICMKCAGALRGLRPVPHRVKSLSMASFTDQDLEVLQNHGNHLLKDDYACNFKNLDKTKTLVDVLQEKYDGKRTPELKARLNGSHEKKTASNSPSLNDLFGDSSKNGGFCEKSNLKPSASLDNRLFFPVDFENAFAASTSVDQSSLKSLSNLFGDQSSAFVSSRANSTFGNNGMQQPPSSSSIVNFDPLKETNATNNGWNASSFNVPSTNKSETIGSLPNFDFNSANNNKTNVWKADFDNAFSSKSVFSCPGQRDEPFTSNFNAAFDSSNSPEIHRSPPVRNPFTIDSNIDKYQPLKELDMSDLTNANVSKWTETNPFRVPEVPKPKSTNSFNPFL